MNSKDSLIQQQYELLNYASSKTSYSVDKIAEKFELVYISFRTRARYHKHDRGPFLALIQKNSIMPHIFYLKDGKKFHDCRPTDNLLIEPIRNSIDDDQSLLDML